jgi:hypothetical protein
VLQQAQSKKAMRFLLSAIVPVPGRLDSVVARATVARACEAGHRHQSWANSLIDGKAKSKSIESERKKKRILLTTDDDELKV